jgi:hypothetical protein
MSIFDRGPLHALINIKQNGCGLLFPKTGTLQPSA